MVAASVTAAVLMVMASVPARAVDPDQGPFNALGGTAGAGVNDSAFIAISSDPITSDPTITATAQPGPVTVQTYVIPASAYIAGNNPITGASNTTLWAPTPSGVTSVTPVWDTGNQLTSIVQSPTSGASINVQQDGDGSRNITVTAVTPTFTGITDANSYGAAFHVFDADTGEWIDPGRSGVVKTIDGAWTRTVDPLVLPESMLGRNIRVGFVIWYYTVPYGALVGGYTDLERFGGLSAAILMRLGGSASSSRVSAALQQFAVPAETRADQCGALAPEHVDAPALVQMRDEGWSIGYAQWPNQGQGGWVCSRQPMLTSLGWIVQ